MYRVIPHRTKPPNITARVLWRTIANMPVKAVVQVETVRLRKISTREKS